VASERLKGCWEAWRWEVGCFYIKEPEKRGNSNKTRALKSRKKDPAAENIRVKCDRVFGKNVVS
jgi:hypothetical protein